MASVPGISETLFSAALKASCQTPLLYRQLLASPEPIDSPMNSSRRYADEAL